jgi:exoribonuclease R
VATNSVSALTREIEWLRKQADEDRRKLEGLESKKEKFKSNLDQIQNKITNMENQAKQDAMEIENLKQAEIANKNVNDALSKETIKLEQERDKFSIDAAKANSNLLQTLEEVKLKRNLISELTKVNLDLESKLKT